MHIDIRVAGKPPWDMPLRESLIRAKVAELVGVQVDVQSWVHVNVQRSRRVAW